jgi:hypothetical protein
VATARSSQAHDKRVRQIAADAAEKVAADSPVEEEVIVVVEERPPDEPAQTQRGRTGRTTNEAENAFVVMIAERQKLIAEGISRWIEMTTAPFGKGTEGMGTFGAVFDARHVTEEAFRLADGVVAAQKDFALKLVAAMTPAKSA